MEAKVLVLDSGYQPLGIISWQRAFVLLAQEKIEIVREYADMFVHSIRQTFKVPSVVRFIKNVYKRVKKVKFSRDNVYCRDRGICQYCTIPVGRDEFTLDHVMPRASGGGTSWENVVVCCVDCNRSKRNRTPEQAGMKLKTKPVKPKSIFNSFGWKKAFPESWKDFLASSDYWFGELENDNCI
jgi:5-methylcytosine-specific restriction endonuclease McrA